MMTKSGSRKISEVGRLTIIPTWMKKTKIKKFQDHIGNVKNKCQNTSQNKTLHEFNVPVPKFKMTNLISKKSKSMQLMTEPLKQKKMYKTVMDKIVLPHLETKHLVMKKKNNGKELVDSQIVLDDSLKEVINANISENCKSTISGCKKTDHNKNKPVEKSMTLECIKTSPEPLVTIEKSFELVPENKPKQFNKNNDRSRIRRHKTNKVTTETDEKLSKIKAKRFESSEVDMFIKKLAAKYGKIAVQKSSKPKRIYENNRQRIKYDLDTDKNLIINERKADPMTKHVKTNKTEKKITPYSKKKLFEFINKDVENRKILKKVNNRTNPLKIEEKNKKATVLRKEHLTADSKLEIGIQFVNKKANSAIKLSSKNGFLKDRDKHVLSTENRKKKIETESSINVREDRNSNKCTNDPEIKSSECCQNEIKNTNKHLISYVPKNTGYSSIITNPDITRLQKEVIPNNDETYELLVNKSTKYKKTDDISQTSISSKKKKESSTRTENIVGEIKNKQTKDQTTRTLDSQQSTEPSKNKNKNIGQHISLKTDSSSKPAEQMKYMKYNPDSPNYICTPKPRIVSSNNNISRGVHSDKPDISRESKKHLRNAQPNFKQNNKISLNHPSGDSKIKPKVENPINLNNSVSSKVNVIKTENKKSLVPSKIYQFQCHSKILDYKLYKLDDILSISMETKQSNNIKPNINKIKTGNLEQIKIFKNKEYSNFGTEKRLIHKENRKLTNVNTVRIRYPSIVNFKNVELKTKKEVQTLSSQQLANPSKRENLPVVMPHTIIDTENQSKPASEVSRIMKGENIQLEEVKDVRSHERKNININTEKLHLFNITYDKEKSNYADTKTVQIKNPRKEIKDEDMSKYGVEKKAGCENDNELMVQCVKTEIHNPIGYNIDYSRRELKKILPFLKHLPNKTENILSNEDTNLESITKKKEKNLFMGKETSLSFKDNANSSSLVIPIKNHSIPFIREVKNKSEIILPTFDNKKKTRMNVLLNEDILYKSEQEKLVEQNPPMITEIQTKKHKIEPSLKRTHWMDKFHELVINKDIFNKKLKKNNFLMHDFNRVSFPKVSEDNFQVTLAKNIFSKHIPTIAIKVNANKEECSKNKINGVQILENDLKVMLSQQLERYNKEIKDIYSETVKQDKIVNIYELFDCSFILQHFNNICESSENLFPSKSSPNDFEFINGTIEKNCNKLVPMQAETNKKVSDMIEKIKTSGRLFIEQNPKITSFIEVFDCRIPMKYTKITVKEPSTEDIGSQMFSLTNSKHMCFYTKFRKNCMGQNIPIKAKQKTEQKNVKLVGKTNIKQDFMTFNKINYLESIPKTSFHGMPMLPVNMKTLTFQDIYNYNHRYIAGIKDKENNFSKLGDKEKTNMGAKVNLEIKSSLNVKKEDKNINHYCQAASEPDTSHFFPVKENLYRAKIEPEVLHYMKKLDTLSSMNGFTMISNDTETVEKNTNEAVFVTEATPEKYIHSNKFDEHSGNKIKNDLNQNEDEAIKTSNLVIKELSYSTDIKFLEKNTTDLSDVINECKRGTFEYLTKVVKEHKRDTKNLSGPASVNIPENFEKSEELFPLKNYKNMDIVKKPPSPKLALDSITLKRAGKSDIEPKISPNPKTESLKKNADKEFKSGINSNTNEIISNELSENSFNKMKVMKNIKEQEKQLFNIRNLEKTLSKINEECNKKLKPMNKKSQENVQKNKAESGSKKKSTTGKNNVNVADNSFEDVCLKTQSTYIQSGNNSKREEIKKHLNNDNTKISNNASKADSEVHTVLNKNYASRIQKGINKETLSNVLLPINEAKNLTKNINIQKGSRNLEKMREKDILIEITTKEQMGVEKININEVRKPISMEKEGNDNITKMNTKVGGNAIEGNKPIKNKQSDIKNINKQIEKNNSESYVTESIPTGFRCIRQPKVENDKEKGIEKCHLKIPISITVCRDRKRIKSPLRKDIGKSVTLAKPTFFADSDTTSQLNQYIVKHKKQVQDITKDKRVKSIKNKLSNNLKPRDGSKMIRRESHTLMSYINAESDKKKNENNKSNSKKGKEDELHLQINNINKIVSIQETKDQTKSTRNIIGQALETENFSNNNSFFDSTSDPVKISTEVKRPYFNIICSENNFNPINEYKDHKFHKIENTELSLSHVANVKNKTGSAPSSHCLKKKPKANQRNQYMENPIYILKSQPKLEGFISQSLRSSNSQTNSLSEMYTVKKRQCRHLTKNSTHQKISKNRIKSELKQSATGLKKKKSKHILKIDMRSKNDQKKNKHNFKLAHTNRIFSQKGLPLHVFQQKELSKNYFLDTPTRQVCGLTPPKQTSIEKPVMPKAKVTTKLMACTQQKDDVYKQKFKLDKNAKNCNKDDNSFLSKIHNIKPEKELKPSYIEIYQRDKGNTSVPNIIEDQFEKSDAEVSKDESKELNINLIGKKDISDITLIINQNKPAHGLGIQSETTVKVSDGNDLSNCQSITDSKADISLPSIVGNVVNSVKTRIQNFLLADIKSQLNEEITSKKIMQEKVDGISKQVSQEKNRGTKLNQNTKQILCSTLPSCADDITDKVQPNKVGDKKKINSKNRDKDDNQRGKNIPDLLGFKLVRNKQTCPQMSYSEVLNKFYTTCDM